MRRPTLAAAVAVAATREAVAVAATREGAAATGTAPSGRTVISTPALPGSCRYFRLVTPRSGGAGCPTTTGITSITPGARAITATSSRIRRRSPAARATHPTAALHSTAA